jgi:fucose permease
VPITGQITGAFLVAASVGGMSLPWIIGQLFEPVGPQVAILAILAALIGATVVFGVLVYYSERKLAAIPSKLG